MPGGMGAVQRADRAVRKSLATEEQLRAVVSLCSPFPVTS